MLSSPAATDEPKPNVFSLISSDGHRPGGVVSGALATSLHTLMSGGTSLIDMMSLPEGDDELAMACLHAAAQGYHESGIRCFLGPHFNDTVDGGYVPNFMGWPRRAACCRRGCAAAVRTAGCGRSGRRWTHCGRPGRWHSGGGRSPSCTGRRPGFQSSSARTTS